MTWAVRRASLTDRDDLARLCRAAVGPGDYVLRNLDDVILRSVVHIALTEAGKPAGMMARRPCVDGSDWLSKARTHPRYRRQGVTKALLASFIAQARRDGSTALRLWTEASNRGGNGSSRSAGFREVARFTRVIGSSATGRGPAGRRAFDEDLWRAIAHSRIIAMGNGYVAHDESFLLATRPVAFAVASRGCFRGRGDDLFAIPASPSEASLPFAMWAGDPRSLLVQACREAAGAGLKEAETFVPHTPELLDEVRRAGFRPGEWGREAVLYEYPLAAERRTPRKRRTYGELAAGQKHRGHPHGSDPLGWARWND